MNLDPRSLSGMGERGEGWDPHCNQHQTGAASQPSTSGGVMAVGRRSGRGWLRYGGNIKLHWTEKEQQILEDGMSEDDGERRIFQYARISLKLHGEKSIRDVALRYKHWIVSQDITGDCLSNGWTHMDADAERVIPNDRVDKTSSLFQQNDLILDQIIQNQKSMKREDTIKHFHHVYYNIQKLLACLNHGTSKSACEKIGKLGSFQEMFEVLSPEGLGGDDDYIS